MPLIAQSARAHPSSCLLLCAATVYVGCGAGSSSGSTSASNLDAGSDAAANAASCPAGPASGDFPCDVGAIIAARCQPCHQNPTKNGAHFSLLSYEDTRQPFGPGTLRFQRMAQVIEPDFLPHMPPHGQPQPTLAELDTLRAWFRGCALPTSEGKGCDANSQ